MLTIVIGLLSVLGSELLVNACLATFLYFILYD